MTKSDLIEHLSVTQKLPKGRAELLVNTLFDCMEQSLKRGERIEIRGFGSFEIRNYRAYEGRNPRTGTTVPVKPKRLPFFKVGKELKERVNGAPEAPHSAGGNGAHPATSNGHHDSNGTSQNGTSTNGTSANGASTTAANPNGTTAPTPTPILGRSSR